MPWAPKSLRAGGAASRHGNAIAFGTNFAAGMIGLTFLGYQIGKRFGHQDAWTLAGLFLGLVYGGYEVWKIVRIFNDTEATRNRDDAPDS